MELTNLEARVIGCLLEKEITTPEQYPLSLNSLTQACNQKTSREPVMSVTEVEVQQALDDLNKKRLISEQSGFGSRVIKYKHRFCNTEFSDLQFTSAELAVVDLLLLRGPQTPGELRTRSSRLCEFSSIDEVEQTLAGLAVRDKPLVKLLPKEPGKREARYSECFSVAGQNQQGSSAQAQLHQTSLNQTSTIVDTNNNDLVQRVKDLETEVSELKALVMELKQLFD